MRTSRRGFTLMELLLGIAVIAILISILLPNLMVLRSRKIRSNCEANLKNIGLALDQYAADNKGKYPPYLGKLTPRYLYSLPSCPSTKLEYQYTYTQLPDRYTVWCNGPEAHVLVRTPEGFPQYDNLKGLTEKKR
jgi:prepilin-type N-terminal cleavage/methylation domain-containing protein